MARKPNLPVCHNHVFYVLSEIIFFEVIILVFILPSPSVLLPGLVDYQCFIVIIFLRYIF